MTARCRDTVARTSCVCLNPNPSPQFERVARLCGFMGHTQKQDKWLLPSLSQPRSKILALVVFPEMFPGQSKSVLLSGLMVFMAPRRWSAVCLSRYLSEVLMWPPSLQHLSTSWSLMDFSSQHPSEAGQGCYSHCPEGKLRHGDLPVSHRKFGVEQKL